MSGGAKGAKRPWGRPLDGGLGFTHSLCHPPVFDIFEPPVRLEATLDLDETVLLVETASADVLRERIEPETTPGPRLGQRQQRGADTLTMQSDLHMQLRDRRFGRSDEAKELRFANR